MGISTLFQKYTSLFFLVILQWHCLFFFLKLSSVKKLAYIQNKINHELLHLFQQNPLNHIVLYQVIYLELNKLIEITKYLHNYLYELTFLNIFSISIFNDILKYLWEKLILSHS